MFVDFRKLKRIEVISEEVEGAKGLNGLEIEFV